MDFLTIDLKRSVVARRGYGGAAASPSSPLPPEDTHWAQSAGVHRVLSPSMHLADTWRTQRNPHAQSSSSEEKPSCSESATNPDRYRGWKAWSKHRNCLLRLGCRLPARGKPFLPRAQQSAPTRGDSRQTHRNEETGLRCVSVFLFVLLLMSLVIDRS